MSNRRIGSMSIFRNARSPQPTGTITLRQLAENIQQGYWADAVGAAHQAHAAHGHGSDEYGDAKKQLAAFTAAGIFSHRANSKLTSHSGLVVVDFDGLSEPMAGAARDLASGSPHVVLAFLSPSRCGIKVLVRVALEDGGQLDEASHRQAWAAAADHLAELIGHTADSAPDVARLCFVSHDGDAHFSPKAQPLAVKLKVDVQELHPVATAVPYEPRTRRPSSTSPEYANNPVAYAEAALADAARHVASTPRGNRHVELLAAARAIGGFCNAQVDGQELELLSQAEVVVALTAAGVQAKERAGYVRTTVLDGLKYGMEAPRVITTVSNLVCRWTALDSEPVTEAASKPLVKTHVARRLVLKRAFGIPGIVRYKGSGLKGYRSKFSKLLREMGLRKLSACGAIIKFRKTDGTVIRICQAFCGDAMCRFCGAQKRAKLMVHWLELFRLGSLYITEQPEEGWDSRKMPVLSVWTWALVEGGKRVILSNCPVSDDSRKIAGGFAEHEAAIWRVLSQLRTKMVRYQQRYGASAGAGLSSNDLPQPKDKKSEWEFCGVCRGVSTVAEALFVAVSMGCEFKSQRTASEMRDCHDPGSPPPLRSAEVYVRQADVDALDVRWQCVAQGSHAAAA